MVWALWLAWASAADAITFAATTSVPEGGTPELRFGSRVMGSLKVRVRCGPKSFALDQAVVPNGTYPLPLPGLSAGRHACSGTVRLDEPDGAWGEMPLSIEVALLPPLSWSFAPDDLDLEAGTWTAHPSRPVSQVTVDRIGVGGVDLGGVSVDLTDPSSPHFSWTPGEEVLQLRVTGTDAAGLSGFLELSPWSYAVPHEDVVFASGSDAIVAEEEPKLERCWRDVEAVLAKYGDVVQIQLFVAGYTDTVGPAAANEGLSQRRAKAIAGWFARRGFSGAIQFQGFGERALAVPTADETDEAANRRALYVLAAEVPPVSEALPQQRWTRLQ